MTDRKTASTINDTELDQLYDQLDALCQVARGYCPHCGRGDAAPTVQDWEQQKRRADQVEELLRIAHDTSNRSEAERARAEQRAEQAERDARIYRKRLARLTDGYADQFRRLEAAKAAIARVRALRDSWLRMTLEPGQVRRLLDDLTHALHQTTPAPTAQATEPREHCGNLKPQLISHQRTECVLNPGHTGSHVDETGCRWWHANEQPDA